VDGGLVRLDPRLSTSVVSKSVSKIGAGKMMVFMDLAVSAASRRRVVLRPWISSQSRWM
jgi:hypothetical protein